MGAHVCLTHIVSPYFGGRRRPDDRKGLTWKKFLLAGSSAPQKWARHIEKKGACTDKGFIWFIHIPKTSKSGGRAGRAGGSGGWVGKAGRRAIRGRPGQAVIERRAGRAEISRAYDHIIFKGAIRPKIYQTMKRVMVYHTIDVPENNLQ